MIIDWDMFWNAASVLFSMFAFGYAFISSRRKDLERTFGEQQKRMDRHDARIAYIEQALQALPGKDDMHGLQLELVKQTGAMEKMAAVMEGNAKITARLEVIVTRHEQHLLDGAKK